MGVSMWLLLFCAGVALLQTVVSQASVPILSRMQRTAINVPEVVADPIVFTCDEVVDKQRFTCGSCTSIMVCNYQKQMVGSYDCSSINPLLPYCKDGKCEAQQDEKCKVPSDLCPDENKFYPVPHNCSEAVFCDIDLQVTTLAAPSTSYMFDIITESWIYRKTPADCFQINCATATNLNKFFTYKPYPQLYIYCGTSGPLTFKCPDNEVYNESTKVCEFGCPREGKYPISGVKDKYYLCLVGQNGAIQKYVESCPAGMEFNENETKCKIVTSPGGN